MAKSTNQPNLNGLFDCDQVAEYLNLSTSYVRKAVAAKTIPYVQIGTRTLFRKSDIDKWIADRVVSAK